MITLPIDLNFLVVEKLPYRFMRLRRDLVTRYFGGFTSDSNFPEVFDPPNPGAMIQQDIGLFSPGFDHLTYTVNNTIPSSGSYDKYSLPLSGPLVLSTLGFRSITEFRFVSLGENSSLMFGLFNNLLDPLTNISDGDLCGFAFETEEGHLWFRGWFGSSNDTLDLGYGLPLTYFTNRGIIIEMEIVEVGITYTMEFRMFLRDLDLDTPFAVFRVSTSVPPTVGWYGITSLGRRFPWMPPSSITTQFEYVDIEPGTGVIYGVNPLTGLTISDAKWRQYQDRPPIQLRGNGQNQVFVALSDDRVVSTVESSDIILVDPHRPVIHVVKLETESPVLVPYAVSPPIPKGSCQPGYSEVSLTWYATQPGIWSLRVNSTSPKDGTELQNGRYDTPGIYTTTTWDYADLHGPDGTYNIALYLINDAGMASGNGLGEYLLPFQHKLGAAMDVSLSRQRGFLIDLSIMIGPAIGSYMDLAIAESFNMMPGLDVNLTAFPIVVNPDFILWTGGIPDGWIFAFIVPGTREITQVGPSVGHGGAGSGAVNIYNSIGSMVMMIQSSIEWFNIGSSYTVTLDISYYGSGTLMIMESAAQFSASYTSSGIKTISFIATQNSVEVAFRILGNGNITIDSWNITKD